MQCRSMTEVARTLLLSLIIGLVVPSYATAFVIDIDIAGAESIDGYLSPNNDSMIINVASLAGYAQGTPLTVTGVGGSGLQVRTTFAFEDPRFADSTTLIAEMSWMFAAVEGGANVVVTPAPGYAFGGAPVGLPDFDIVNFEESGVAPLELPSGALYIEFFEDIDNVAGARDAKWSAGTIHVQGVAVPEPGTAACLGLALARLLARYRPEAYRMAGRTDGRSVRRRVT